MNKIRFSHQYAKLLEVGQTAILLEVIKVKLENLSPEFIAYDTDYGRYKFPHGGDYLLLLFLSNTRLFTTIRPFKSDKNDYYKKRIGRDFEIVIRKEK